MILKIMLTDLILLVTYIFLWKHVDQAVLPQKQIDVVNRIGLVMILILVVTSIMSVWLL